MECSATLASWTCKWGSLTQSFCSNKNHLFFNHSLLLKSLYSKPLPTMLAWVTFWQRLSQFTAFPRATSIPRHCTSHTYGYNYHKSWNKIRSSSSYPSSLSTASSSIPSVVTSAAQSTTARLKDVCKSRTASLPRPWDILDGISDVNLF